MRGSPESATLWLVLGKTTAPKPAPTMTDASDALGLRHQARVNNRQRGVAGPLTLDRLVDVLRTNRIHYRDLCHQDEGRP
jgi:hypothetical protein